MCSVFKFHLNSTSVTYLQQIGTEVSANIQEYWSEQHADALLWSPVQMLCCFSYHTLLKPIQFAISFSVDTVSNRVADFSSCKFWTRMLVKQNWKVTQWVHCGPKWAFVPITELPYRLAQPLVLADGRGGEEVHGQHCGKTRPVPDPPQV